MIYIRTFAFNAEKTIVKTIESVLSQTVGEFQYYLMDNGSTDSTGDIIRDYAKKDSRIVPFYNKVNSAYEENPEFWDFTTSLKDDDYYVALDADDYYAPTFLEELLGFMESENLDMAACGTEFFNGDTGAVLGSRVLKNSVVLSDSASYDMFFPYIHWNLRQVWGKVYTGRVAKEMPGYKKPDWWPKGYGGDTANVYTCMQHVNRLGIYAKVLHHYRKSVESVSHKWIEGRENAEVVLHEKTKELIFDKVGFISDQNQQFLHVAYLNGIKDTLDVLAKVAMPDGDKVRLCAAIFCNPTTVEALNGDISLFEEEPVLQNVIRGYKKAFLNWGMDVLANLKEEDMVHMVDFCNSFNDYLGVLLSQEQICELLRQSSRCMFEFLVGNYVNALQLLEKEMDNKNTVSQTYLILAQNIAALISDEERYVAYSKKLIGSYIEKGQNEKAKRELEEWLEILPNDSDFIEMRNRI